MGKKTGITLGLAVVAVAVAGLLTFQVFGPGILPGSKGYERMDAEGVAGAEALAGYDSLPDETDRLVGEAYAAVDQAHMDARTAIEEHVAEVNATIQSALSEVHVAEIPAEVDVEEALSIVAPDTYTVPELPDGIVSPDLSIPVWQAPAQDAPASDLGALPRTGIAPIDEGLGQIEAVYEGLVGGSDPLGGFGDPFQGTPLEGQAGPLGGAPEAPDAGAVDPDEDSALEAKGHAAGFLGSAGERYDVWTLEVQGWIEVQSDLVDELEALEADVDEVLAETETLVDTELEERLTDIQVVLDDEIARIEGTIGSLEDLRTRVAVEETEALQALAEAQAESILATGEAQVSILLSHAESIDGDLQAQIEALQTEGQEVLDGLAEYEVQTGVSMQAEAEAVMAAVTEAQEALMAQAEAQQVYLVSEAEAIRAGSSALAHDVLAQTEGAFDDLLTDVEGQAFLALESGAYWTEAWAVWAETSAQAEVEFASEFLSEQKGSADQLLGDASGTAFGITEDGLRLAETVLDLSQQIELDAIEDVGLDLDIIGAVRDDYSTVPTPDRQERAEYWSGVMDNVTGGVDSLLFVSSHVQGLGEELYRLSAEVRGTLESG